MARLPGCSNLNIIDFGIAVQEARENLAVPVSDLARMIGCADQRLIYIEAFGISSQSKYFEPLCELLGLDQNHFKRMEERKEKLRGNTRGHIVSNKGNINERDTDQARRQQHVNN